MMNEIIELEREGFRLFRRPKHNKKERRHLGLPKDREVIIEVAAGFMKYKKTHRYIVQTAEIVSYKFNSTSGYFEFETSNGKCYKVNYK
jgi:hypothetical protein